MDRKRKASGDEDVIDQKRNLLGSEQTGSASVSIEGSSFIHSTVNMVGGNLTYVRKDSSKNIKDSKSNLKAAKSSAEVTYSEKQSWRNFLKCSLSKLKDRVPLLATKQENVSEEEFGNSSSWLFKKQSDKKNIMPENIFEEAACAYNEKRESSHENSSKQNVTGLVGIAGIGKTTFCKFVLKHWIESYPHSFVFYISIRDVDFAEKISVLKFLLVSTDHDHKFKQKKDDLILKEINESVNTLIVIDGLDEAEITGDFSKHPYGMSLYEEKPAYCILMNLVKCRLLPKAKKLIASRPNAFLNFNPKCKPEFMLQVLGLSKESQNLLCKQYSKTEEQLKHVQDELEKQPNVSALLFIPIFAKLIIPYFVDNLMSNKPVLSTSDVFLSQLERWQHKQKFHTDRKHLKQLTKLAFSGVENRQFSFPSSDFEKHGIEIKFIEPFMCTHAKNPQQHGLLILDGKKTFFFIHATWQEFLAALHLMVFASYEEFLSKIEQIFQQSSWDVVVRFLFGFCHREVQDKLKILFPHTQQSKNKEKIVKTQAKKLLPHLSELPNDFPITPREYFHNVKKTSPHVNKFNSRDKDPTLFNMCSWANESKDDEFTKAVANSLPGSLLLSGNFLPHQIMSSCHVLSASKEPRQLQVGDWWNPDTFTELGLHMLLGPVQQSKYKIPKLHLKEFNLTLHFEIIMELLPGITELTLRACGLTIPMVENLFDVITEHNIHLLFLDLSSNKLDGIGKYVAKSMHMLQVLSLYSCNLQEEDFNAIAEATTKRDTNMIWLNFSENVMSKSALDNFASGVHKLDGLGLDSCSVTGDGLEQLCHEISKRQKPMNILGVGGNNIESIGVNLVLSCINNIRQLLLCKCNLTITCLRALVAAILDMDHSMVYLNLRDNRFGDEGAIVLADCLSNLENLDVFRCAITVVGAKALQTANFKWKRHIGGLPDIPKATAASSGGRPREVAQPKKRCSIS